MVNGYHDDLYGSGGYKHVNHSTIGVNTSENSGLRGGGDATEFIEIELDPNNLVEKYVLNGNDYVPVADSEDSFATKKILASNFGSGESQAYENFIVNSSCLIQRGIEIEKSDIKDTGAIYAFIDRFACRGYSPTTNISGFLASGTTNYEVSENGNVLYLSADFEDTDAFLEVYYRVPSYDARVFQNKSVSFSVKTIHYIGSAVNYTISFRRPIMLDTFSIGMVNISTSSDILVQTDTATTIKFENINVGDTSNGFEVVVKVKCGDISWTEIDFAEFQLNRGAVVSAFKYIDTYGTALAACNRFFFKTYLDVTGIGTSEAISGSIAFTTDSTGSIPISSARFPMELRGGYSDPHDVAVFSTKTGAKDKIYNETDNIDVSVSYVFKSNISFEFTATIGASKKCSYQYYIDAELY